MSLNISIVWATGAVGREMIECIYQKNIPFDNLKLFGSSRSAWSIMETSFWDMQIRELTEDELEDVDVCLFSAWSEVSKKRAETIVSKWIVMIDNSSAFRYDENVPLVIPEINSEDIWNNKLIANPNCTTAILDIVVYPIYKSYGIQKMIVSTYQATSGSWDEWIQELIDSTAMYLEGQEVTFMTYDYPIAFNHIPAIDQPQDNLYTKEEMKVSWETRKIFGDDNLNISCTAVRTPTVRSHCESVTIETSNDVDLQEIRKILDKSPWVELMDDLENKIYPMPYNTTSKWEVGVGRIRKNNIFGNKGLDLFISGDQLLKWAALNAVQIMESCFCK